ncbi:MAG: M28 family metallopeptidase [Alphaproteobacteria bacterium]
MMRSFGIAGLGVLVLLLASCEDPAPSPPLQMSEYLDAPSAMAFVRVMAGRDRTGRTNVVKQALAAAGIAYQQEPVVAGRFRGSNIIVEVGLGDKSEGLVIIIAHTDPVPDTAAANDNASCVAAALSAVQTLNAAPPNNLRVRFLFSDGEEYGLLGAKRHGERKDLGGVLGVVSFELCGIGDAFGIWDVTGAVADSVIVRALQKAGGTLDIYNGLHGAVPRFGSDHRAFSDKGIAAVGVTVLPRDDEATLRRYVDNPDNPLWLINFLRPVIFRTYHTPNDKPDTIEPAALDMTTRLMVETVRVLDNGVGEK